MAEAPVVAYVGLGANLGEPHAALRDALTGLSRLPGTQVVRVSPTYRTAPVDATGPDFLNAVAALSTTLGPADLLAQLHRLEAECGRERPYRNAPRTLDLDLLLHGDTVVHTAELTLPHPRMHARAFVLVPLADVAPEALAIPGHGPVRQLLAGVAGQGITRLSPLHQETP